MKFKENINRRADKIEKFIKGNFIYTITAIAVICFLLFSGFFSTEKEKSANIGTKVSEEQKAEKEERHFKIYTSDYVILFGSIAFCTVMILRRNANKEEI